MSSMLKSGRDIPEVPKDIDLIDKDAQSETLPSARFRRRQNENYILSFFLQNEEATISELHGQIRAD